MKNKTNMVWVVVAMLTWATAPCIRAAVVNVFLDDGSHVSGSSNSGTPYANNDRDVTWDVAATAESGLADIGAAVMSVRMVTVNVNGDSRGANSAGGNGLAVSTGSNGLWFDGGTREAVLFQFSFYSDLAKTTEMTGLDMDLVSIVSRVATGTTKVVDAFVGSGVLTFDPSTNFNNTTDVFLGGTLLSAANDATNSFDSALGYKTTNDALGFYIMTNAVVGRIESFSEDDSLWIRRRNSKVGDAAYQLGGLRFEVVSTATGYAAWASFWGVDIGSETNDYDGDGLLNVYEYGLGGDPTNAADRGISPVYAADGGTFSYIHPQRSDANSGITYHLELNTDLVAGVWTNAGYTVDGTNIVAGDFDYVTNTTTTVEAEKFIRLIIE